MKQFFEVDGCRDRVCVREDHMHWRHIGDTGPASPPHGEPEVEPEPSKPERKVGRHEGEVKNPKDDIVVLKGTGLDTDPRVRGKAGLPDPDDIIRMRIGDEVVDQAQVGLDEAARRAAYRGNTLTTPTDSWDESLEDVT